MVSWAFSMGSWDSTTVVAVIGWQLVGGESANEFLDFPAQRDLPRNVELLHRRARLQKHRRQPMNRV